MMDLNAEFHQAMVGIYERALRDLGYNARFFIEMVAQHGGVETARRLLSTDEVQYGFDQLWQHRRLDLTVEFHVLQPRFRELFDENISKEATARLRDLKYVVDDDGNLRQTETS